MTKNLKKYDPILPAYLSVLKSKRPTSQASNWFLCNWIFNTMLTTARHWSTNLRVSSLRPTSILSSNSCQSFASRQLWYSKCFSQANWLSRSWWMCGQCFYNANFCLRCLAITAFHQPVWKFKFGLRAKFFM